MIRLSKSCLGEEEKAAVRRVLDVGYLGMGPEVQAFEQELSSYLGGEVSVTCVNTGTAALHLAFQAIGLKPGDEVLVPTLTYLATFQAVSATGATPVACDVEEKTGLLDVADAAKRVTSRTKAIAPVHYAGEVGEIENVYALAEAHGLRVVEDAAHAMGSSHLGKKVGSFGDIVALSFDGIKNITSGEGGAVVTRDRKITDRVRDARLLGVISDSERRYRGERSWDFEVEEQGWRYHMSDLMAAIGREQLKKLDTAFAPRRRSLAARYRENLKGVSGTTFFHCSEEAVPFMLPIRILRGRDECQKECGSQGIQVGIHYKPNHLLKKYASKSLPVAEALYLQLLSLPLHPELQDSQVDKICEAVKRAISKG